jgi:hypothetical protein
MISSRFSAPAASLAFALLGSMSCGVRTSPSVECAIPVETTLRATWIAAPRQLDVVTFIDVTGSMRRELLAFRARAAELTAAFYHLAPEVRVTLGIVSAEGGVVGSLGFRSGDPVVTEHDLGSAADFLTDGGDPPEDQLAGPYAFLIRDAARFRPTPSEPCSAPLFGLGCLDPTVPRVFLLATDGPFHLGPGGRNPYPTTDPQPLWNFETVVDLLQTTHTRLVAGYGNSGGVVEQDVEPLVRLSGAVRPDGSAIAIEGQDEAAVDALLTALDEWRTLVPYDLSVRASVLDADAALVRSVRIARISPTPTGPMGDDRAAGVARGATVELEVEVDPARVRPGRTAHIELQLLDADIQVLDRIELVYVRPLNAFGSCVEDGGVWAD